MRVLFLVLGLALAPLPGRAETILVNSSHGGIFEVDIQTLAVKQVTTGPQLFDIAVGPDGRIVGIAGNGQLWRMDPGGAHQPLGIVGEFVNALTFDAHGGLVGAGLQVVVGISPDDGATQRLGVFFGQFSSGDVTFGPDRALYATVSPGPRYLDTLFRLGPDGGMTAVGPIGFRNVYGLVWSRHFGTLVGVTEARELIAIDPSTGAGRLIGTLAFAGRGYGAAGFGAGPATIGRPDRAVPAPAQNTAQDRARIAVAERHSDVSSP